MTSIRVVLVTAPRGDVAVSIARGLVEAGLAACVNIVPGVRSIYAWQGAICDDGEDLLIAKTAEDRLEALVAHVRAVHPYSVPEVVALPVEAGSAAYLDWVAGETRPR
jgi:periplasmic divalent cation tolerance protein